MLAMAAACLGPSSILGSNGPREIEGWVSDDGGNLPVGQLARLAGVRAEVLDGPKAGAFVVTDAAGTYRLPPMGDGPINLRATKSGFDAQTQQFNPEFFLVPPFMLGRPPHTLWGDVVLSRTTPSVLIPHVQVEILDGPNDGKVVFSDENGRYRFDDLIASPLYALRFSKAGYQTRNYPMTELRHNEQRNVQIDAQ